MDPSNNDSKTQDSPPAKKPVRTLPLLDLVIIVVIIVALIKWLPPEWRK
jgi:hypothetical protein